MDMPGDRRNAAVLAPSSFPSNHPRHHHHDALEGLTVAGSHEAAAANASSSCGAMVMDAADSSTTSAMVAASPLLFACRSVVGSLEAERIRDAQVNQQLHGTSASTRRNVGGSFCDPELLKRLSGVLQCQRTLVWEATSASLLASSSGDNISGGQPLPQTQPRRSPSFRTSSPPSTTFDSDALVAAMGLATSSPTLVSLEASTAASHAAVNAMVSCGQQQMASATGAHNLRTSPRTGRPSSPSNFSASASSTSSVFDAVPPPAIPHDPYTDGEPLRWVVPPGVGDVAVADMSVQWSLTAGSQFSSALCNAAVIRGKWMYEVTLASSGLLQIGWSAPMLLFPWTPRLGVGDFPFTVAFDGHRQQLWNVQATACGHRWAAGDVITCCLDLDEGVATFYQNGERVGVKDMLSAATADARAGDLRRSMVELGYPSDINIPASAGHFLRRNPQHYATSSPLGPTTGSPADDANSNVSSPFRYDSTLCYSPALSLGQYESAMVNLGRAPFRYPVAGFSPIDRQGALETSLWRARASLLTDGGVLKPYRSTVMLALIQQLRLVAMQQQQHQQQQQQLQQYHQGNGGSPPLSPTTGATDHNSHGSSATYYGGGGWHAFSMMFFDAFLHQATSPATMHPCPVCSPSTLPRTASGASRGATAREPAMDALCTTCALLSLLEMCLQPDEIATVASTVASYCAFRAGSRRLDSSAAHSWTASPELRILQICTAKSAMFRRAWSQSATFSTDFLNVFRVKSPSNFDLMSVLFPVSNDRTASVIRRQRNLPSPGQYQAMVGGNSPPAGSQRTSPTTVTAVAGIGQQQQHNMHHHHHLHHHHHHHHHRQPAVTIPPEDEEPIPSADEAHADHENRSAVLHDCVIGLDDNRREGILSALLDCPHSEGPTVLAVSMAVDELRRLLAANQQQLRNANGGVLPQHMRPRFSDVCVDSAVAARLFFSLIQYIGRNAEEVRRTVQQQQKGSGAEALLHSTRAALRDVFLPQSILREPLIEGIEFTRLGGPHAVLHRSLLPQLTDLRAQLPHPQRSAKSTLFMKSVILYSAAVKELVISACGDMLLRHRQREAWSSHMLALQYDAYEDSVKQQQQQQQSTSLATSQSRRLPAPQQQPATTPTAAAATPSKPKPQTGNGTASRRLSDVAANRLLLDMLVSGRTCAWSTATLFLNHRGFEDIGEFCALVVDVMTAYDALPDYPLLPIVLVECFVDVWHFARKTAPDYVKLVHMYPQNIMFFVDRVLDPRVAHVETNEYLLLSLAGILDSQEPHREAVAYVLSQHQRQWNAALHRLMGQLQHPLGWPLSVGVWTKLGVGNYFCLVELEDDSAEWRDAFPMRLRQNSSSSLSGATSTTTAVTTTVKPTMPTAITFYKNFFANVFLADAPFAQKFFRQVMTHCHYCVSELGVSLSAVWQHLSGSINHSSSSNNNNGGGSSLTAHEFSTLRRATPRHKLDTRKVLHILEFVLDSGKHLLLPSTATNTTLVSSASSGGTSSVMSSASTSSSSGITTPSSSTNSRAVNNNIHQSFSGSGDFNSPPGSASNRSTTDAQHNLHLLVELWTQTVSRFCTPKASIALVEQYVAT
ncbi:Hypothetical protein, putative, partial [Bodo saltans]